MAEIEYKGELPKSKKENKIRQGDFVYCKSTGGAISFWGIYSESIGSVIDLNGAGSSYIVGSELYLGETYSYWTIIKRVPCDKMKITLEEIS